MTSHDSATTGVVVMAYGTPASLDDLEGYYTHIRRGRPPTPELLADLRRRYEAIGGLSPLLAITEAQRAGIAAALGDGHVVAVGHKHAAPFIEDGVAEVLAAGAQRVVGVVLAPHYSRGSVGEYAHRLRAAVDGSGGAVASTTAASWADLDPWVDFQATAVRAALDSMPEATKVLFTAHSLPERVLVDDPYPQQLFTSAKAIAQRAGLAAWVGWGLGWQSAGRTPDPWRGPDILEVIADLAGTGRAQGVVVCAQGFAAEGLELRYDLDIEARAAAQAAGLAFARTPAPDADPAILAALADRVAAVARDLTVGGPPIT